MPRAARYDRTGKFPWDNIRAINALGLNAMFVPEAYGGAGLSYAAYLACVREISRACASTGIIWATTFHAAKPLIDFGSEAQKKRLLPRVAEGAGGGLTLLLAALNKSRPSVAAHALGIARAAFEDAVAYINERRQSGRRIVEFQGIQFLIADLATELAMCEAWLWHVARLVDDGVSDIGIEASMLKLRASDLAMRITTEAVQLHGGYGYIKEYRVERLLRDAKITQIWEGTNQIHRQLIGRSFIARR